MKKRLCQTPRNPTHRPGVGFAEFQTVFKRPGLWKEKALEPFQVSATVRDKDPNWVFQQLASDLV